MARVASPTGVLAERFPGLACLPRRALTELPSPLEPAADLGAAIGIPSLYCKRDDVAARDYAGNKVRKLEYLLGDALARGCTGLVTFGAAGSNHALATAIHARAAGLDCHAILTDQLQTPYVADTLRWHALLGTRLWPANGFADAAAKASALRDAEPGLCEIPWGGSSWLGTVGFVAAGVELAAGLAAAGLSPPARIYLPCGTMGSVAGLLLGLRAVGASCTIVAVKVVPGRSVDTDAILRLCAETNAELRARDPDFPTVDTAGGIEFRTQFLGADYAAATPEVHEAVRLAGDCGLKLETTYSGKAMACLIADGRAGRAGDAGPTIFWHTYNSRPYPPAIRSVSAADLPEPFRKYLPDGEWPDAM